ncbi:hypothetical protein D9758_000931 [Tetrapyrgos nigripes]|uniref:HORMA domain-containing protein n=1 Tax=Tetrapyrgos nigripes TaxID=182062 RepID=A0A8H5GYZ6_9AGAR|nr:hypothetical protein D9758_000931 [Tetrapyrgos nigripes]
MQAQAASRTETRAVSSATSVEVVETLLKAGLGCITFMRDLLPQDNFQESQLTTAEDGMSYSSSSFSTPDKRNASGFKIMTMSRGYTDEADRILNYLEYGIFDALRKQYLRSFIFAIYLDNNDPNNIVEAYTFNFQYHPVAGTNETVPVMTLEDKLNKTSLRDNPIAQAAKNGKVPTLKDVKRSLKHLLKTLITSMTQMDVLPKRRYASFKLFYTDDTPADYEPPHFKPGDFEKDKWYFMTHDLDEVPDTWSVGKLDSGYHSVSVNVSSIATFLPSSTDHENAPFAGTTQHNRATGAFGGFTLTPAEEAVNRAEQTAKQLEDAENRNIVWSAEPFDADLDADADGDDDPDYVKPPGGSFVQPPMIAIGIRNEEGVIEAIATQGQNQDQNEMEVDQGETHFFGVTQSVPTGLKELSKVVPATSFLEQTQIVDDPQDRDPNSSPANTPTIIRPTTARRPILSPLPSSSPRADGDIDTQMERLALGNATVDDSEMLDLETQIEPAQIQETQTFDPIESFGSDLPIQDDIRPEALSRTLQKKDRAPTEVVECECGIPNEDESCACEGGCGRWYHIWCMGYHSEDDPRLPGEFTCLDCRLHADPSWDLIKVDIYPTIMSNLKELALFRRAIKVVENQGSDTAMKFAKPMGNEGLVPFFSHRLMVAFPGCDNALARQLWKRLETEEFIVEQVTTIDDIGFKESRSRTKTKGKGKQTKQRRNIQKQTYIFNRNSKKTKKYADYFNPDPEVEGRLLGVPQTKAMVKARNLPAVPQAPLPDLPSVSSAASFPQTQTVADTSQTQDDTQMIADLKRPGGPCGDDDPRPKKKVKISVATPIDLAE